MILLLALALDDLETLKKRYPEDKTAVIAQIGALKTDEAAAYLRLLYQTEKDDAVRVQAVAALGRCRTPEGQRAVVAIATDAKSSHRAQAFSALARYPLSDTETTWRSLLADPLPGARAAAFSELAPLRDRTVLALARTAVEDPKEARAVKFAALEAWHAEDGPDAVRLYLAFAPEADATQRGTLLAWLTALRDASSIDALYAHHRTPAARALAARTLGKLRHEKAIERLDVLLEDKSLIVRIAAVESVAERADPRSEEILRREAQRGDDDASIAAIGALSDSKLLTRLADAKSWKVRAAAVEALESVPDILPIYARALAAKEWQVRAAAIGTLSQLPCDEAVDLLIERMGKEDGRLLGDIGHALTRLTNLAIGYDAKLWRAWWKDHRGNFVFPDPKCVGEATARGVTYCGLPVVSKRIAFCIDASKSMSARMGKETRFERAHRELSGSLSSLDKEVHANVIRFDDKVESWEKQLMPVRSNLPRMLGWLRFHPRGATNLYGALARAFEDPWVDTIYLLSDGTPGAGEFLVPEEILREVKRVNRYRQIRIHTISFGDSPFLRRLADQNGGQYTLIK